jgi:hypothetical protein
LFSIINLSVIIIIFAVSTVLATVTRSNFSRALIASSVLILVPSISYFYVLIFSIIPFMEFIKNYNSFGRKKQAVYVAAYFFMLFTLSLLTKNYIVHSLVLLAMFIIECHGIIKNEVIPYFLKRKS